MADVTLRTIDGRVRALIVVAVLASLLFGKQAPAQENTPTTTRPTTTAVDEVERDGAAGQIAYVTPSGDVVVARGDGSEPRVIGSGAASNGNGLAPIAWRQPASDAIAYVREDRALVVASTTEDVEPLILATDAVVPAYTDDEILSWDVSGSLLIYLAETRPGQIESRVVDLTTSDDGSAPEIRTIGNPERRTVVAQAFSPLDPIIYQETADSDTGEAFTVAIVEPFGGTVFGSDYSLDDVAFTPDGRYVFGVSRGVGDIEQMVRIDLRKPTGSVLVTDQVRICHPSVSPDARTIVFASGTKCEEVWTINSDGTDPKRIATRLGGTSVFDVGKFSWSQDAQVITHPACTRSDDTTDCNGGYWDISVDGSQIVQRAVAGQVLREFRPLLRPVKLEVLIDGPIGYIGKMQVGVNSVGDLLAENPQEVIEAKGVDSDNNARSFTIKAVHPRDSDVIAGSIRVVDGEFDETFPFFGRVLPSSLGYVSFRGIWLRSETFPLMSGQLTVTLER